MEAGENKRNIALVGPNGAGKTTLLESLLFVSGTIPRKGRVMDRNTIGDASPEARERQMSTEVTAATLVSRGIEITLLDCPGSVEFAQETRAALMGVDLALVVVEPLLERMIALAPSCISWTAMRSRTWSLSTRWIARRFASATFWMRCVK